MRRISMPTVSIVALLFVAAAGCNAPGSRSRDAGKLTYGVARGLDFMDIFEFNVSAGPGLLATVAVEPFKAGYGYSQTSRFGMDGRAFGTWDECRKELFVGLHHLNQWHKRPCQGNGYLFTPEVIQRHSHQRDPGDFSRLTFYEEWDWTTRYEDWEKQWLDVTAEVHVFFLGLNVAFSPQEFFDFLLGVCTVDAISHDDYGSMPEEVMEPEFTEQHERY